MRSARAFFRGVHVSVVGVAIALVAACGDDGGGGAGSTTTGASSTSAGTPGCAGEPRLTSSDDAAPGPWVVGARSVRIGNLDVEIFYPAVLAPTDKRAPKTYDVRAWLPDSEKGKITDDKAPKQRCDCFDGLDIDATHGPYPVVQFVHGTAGFRTQSLALETHWASHGFVVVAADHPGLYLGDLIRSVCGQTAPMRSLDADLAAVRAALAAPSGDLAFLAGRVDTTRVGLTGHSAGGAAIEAGGDVAQVLIPMAAGGTLPGAALKSTLVLSAREDQVVASSEQIMGFDTSPAPKRLAVIAPAGHLLFSDLCTIQNDAGQDMVTVGQEAMVCGLSLAGALFDCDPTYLGAEAGTAIVADLSTAALKETLTCDADAAARLGTMQARHPEIVDYR